MRGQVSVDKLGAEDFFVKVERTSFDVDVREKQIQRLLRRELVPLGLQGAEN